MGYSICICNNSERLLDYPVEQFTADLADRLASGPSLIMKTRKKRKALIRVIADDLILKFKIKSVALPPHTEGQ